LVKPESADGQWQERKLKIGVLALQGAFVEHIQKLRELGVQAGEVRLPPDLQGISGLIIPGGESTAIGKLMTSFGLLEPIRRFADANAVWGTCAGMILMAKQVGQDQPVLGFMNIAVARNAFGRQIDSFEENLRVAVLKGGDAQAFPGIFIRAPRLLEVRRPAQVIARLADGTAVAAMEGKWLATAFHPELSRDLRFHQHFMEMVRA
jgi:5'-phosphate synthase pdxT subunit